MVATKDQVLDIRIGFGRYGYPIDAAVRVFKRTLVGVTAAGLARPAATAGVVAIVGMSTHHADNRDGLANAGKVEVERGLFPIAFDVAPAFADIGKAVYAVDDNTVSLDHSANSRLRAGTLDAIEDGTPWIRV